MRKLLIILGSSVAILLLIIACLPVLLENKIKKEIVSEINQQVSVPVEVKGGMKLSIFDHFPNASFTFSEVVIGDRLRKDQNLLRVKEFSFLCNILSLIKGDMDFSKALLRDGEINLFADEQGNNNYDILKKSDKPSEGSLSIQLQKAEIKQIKLSFIDKRKATDLNLNLKHAELTGNFSDTKFELNTALDMRVHHIIAGGEDYLSDKNVKAEVLLDVNKAEGKFYFRKGEVEIDGNKFHITGSLASLKTGTQVDFKLVNEGKDFHDLFQLLPKTYKENFAKAEGSGQYSIIAEVRGIVGPNSAPAIHINADFKDSQLKLGEYNKLLKKVNATAKYEMDETGKDRLIIGNFNCTLNNLPFNFSLRLNNLADPTFDFFANGVMHLSELSTFIPASAASNFKGEARFNNFHLQGRKKDFVDVENSSLRGSGDFTLLEAGLTSKGVAYEHINGTLAYGARAIEAKDFTIQFLKTDFRFTGNIENLLAYVYTLADKKRTSVATLGINGKLHTKTLDLSSMINGYSQDSKKPDGPSKPVKVRDIFNLRGNLDIEIDRLLFRQTVFEKVRGNIQAAPGLLRVNQFSASAMEGDMRGNGLFSFTADNKLNIQSDVTAVNLNIHEVFRQCESFGQTSLTEKHLEGNVNFSVTSNATWINYSDFDEKGFAALIEISIRNGRLINFEPLRAASKFIRVEELQDIRFSDLTNTLKIANSRVDIPSFELKSSALNMILSGYHYFNNDVNYQFKINLHKLLAKKFNRNGRDVQYIENDPYEGLNIYLSMTGNLSNPIFKYDKTSSKQKLLSDFKKEKENLKTLFSKTSKKVDEKENRREDKYFDLNQTPEFMDFDTTSD